MPQRSRIGHAHTAMTMTGTIRLLSVTALISLIALAHDFAYLPRTPLWSALDWLLFPHFVAAILALAFVYRGHETQGWAGLFIGAAAGLPVSFVYAVVLRAIARRFGRRSSN